MLERVIVDVENPYMETANGMEIDIVASSTAQEPPHPGTLVPPISGATTVTTQVPFEQAVKFDVQTRPIEPQLLKSISRFTHDPDDVRI